MTIGIPEMEQVEALLETLVALNRPSRPLGRIEAVQRSAQQAELGETARSSTLRSANPTRSRVATSTATS